MTYRNGLYMLRVGPLQRYGVSRMSSGLTGSLENAGCLSLDVLVGLDERHAATRPPSNGAFTSTPVLALVCSPRALSTCQHSTLYVRQDVDVGQAKAELNRFDTGYPYRNSAKLMANIRLACGLIVVALVVIADAIAVSGVQAGVDFTTGRRPFRQEFSTFRNSGPAFDLYILALQKFQQRRQSDPLSYFGIAGIRPGI
ncbi:MAG: hypothetical protein Q9173_003767 [Seirophora scorigena]